MQNYDKGMLDRGIHFVTDENGKKIAVQINLEVWGELWEDICDVLMSESRKSEPTVSWADLQREIKR